MSNERLLHLPQITDIHGFSSAQVWLQEQDGLWPRRIKIGTRTAAWPESEVRLVIAARVAGVNDEGIRTLVARLHAQRGEHYAELQRTVLKHDPKPARQHKGRLATMMPAVSENEKGEAAAA